MGLRADYRVIVCGSRKWRNHEQRLLREVIANRLFELPPGSTIVHGAAGGVDTIAKQEAEKMGHYLEPYPAADFVSPTVNHKRAPLERNIHMASLGADLCVCFWNGKSTGTQHMRDRAAERGIPVEIIQLREE